MEKESKWIPRMILVSGILALTAVFYVGSYYLLTSRDASATFWQGPVQPNSPLLVGS
jgi:hypothetical protein